MGIVVLGALGLYLIVLIACVVLAARAAKKRHRSPLVWGSLAALAIYLPVFWDHIPTVLLHNYYCEKEAGLFIHKTAEQWKAQNPGIADALKPEKLPPLTRVGDMDNYVDTYVFNERLRMVVNKSGPYPLHRWRRQQKLIDIKTDEVLATNIDFSRGCSPATGGRAQDWFVSLKFWLFSPRCTDGGSRDSRFHQFKNTFPGVQI